MQDAFYEWKCSPRADLGLPFYLTTIMSKDIYGFVGAEYYIRIKFNVFLSNSAIVLLQRIAFFTGSSLVQTLICC